MYKGKLNAQGIFLDLDGTIVDSREAYIEAAAIAFKRIGLLTPDIPTMLEIPRRLEQGLRIDDLINCDRKQFLSVYLDAYYSVTEAKTKLIPNIMVTLAALSNKSKLALITMRHVPNQVILKELDFFGISKYFNHVVTALDTFKPKPSPEALIKCVEALNLDICNCIITGDSVNDVKAGKAAGAKTVAVLSGLFYPDELAKEHPDLILPDVTSLPRFIE